MFEYIVAVCGGIITIVTLLKLIFIPVMKFIKKSNENDEKLEKAIDKLSEKVDNNEKDRIRSEVFRYGNIARMKKPISNEEFRSLQMDFDKYSSELKGNGIVLKEMDYITDYYNRQF